MPSRRTIQEIEIVQNNLRHNHKQILAQICLSTQQLGRLKIIIMKMRTRELSLWTTYSFCLWCTHRSKGTQVWQREQQRSKHQCHKCTKQTSLCSHICKKRNILPSCFRDWIILHCPSETFPMGNIEGVEEQRINIRISSEFYFQTWSEVDAGQH